MSRLKPKCLRCSRFHGVREPCSVAEAPKHGPVTAEEILAMLKTREKHLGEEMERRATLLQNSIGDSLEEVDLTRAPSRAVEFAQAAAIYVEAVTVRDAVEDMIARAK